MSISQRIEKLEKLLKLESEPLINSSDNFDDEDYEYSPKYMQAAQRLCDKMDTVAAMLEAVPADMDMLHIDKKSLYKMLDFAAKIKEDAASWFEY